MLVGLSLAETISWGVVYYSFSVFIRPIEAETGWSRTQVTGAFSAALLASGLSAVPVGHWLDARGPRGLMTAGAVAGSLLLLALAGVESLPAFYAIWAGLGVVMAMVLYEPAFAVVATWFVRHRDRALTVLTVGGGLASTLVVPAATWLQQRHGWRAAATGLAVALAVTTVPLHALLLRRGPSAVGQRPDGDPASTEDVAPVAPPRLGPVMAEGRFWGLTAAFTLASVAAVATSVHVIPYLTERHYSPMAAGTVLGLVGFMQLPGRLVFGPLRRALSWPWAAAAVFLLQGAAIAVLALVPGRAGLGAFVCGFGMANGMCTLLRASMVAELYGPGRYGRVGGVLALFGTAGRAAGPVLASLALAAGASYAAALSALGGLLVAAALLVLLPWRLAPLAAEVAPSAT